MDARVEVVVTGGGTSGHVVPAIAILESLRDTGSSPSSLRYVGARRGVETRLVAAETGVECEFLGITGLKRSITPRSIVTNLLLPLRLFVATVRAIVLLRRWRPRVVVSVGGYASEPTARAAVLTGVPLVCVSYDRTPGLATRRQARRAVACATAFADSPLPRAVHTGAPVRARLRSLDVAAERDDARQRLGVSGSAVVVAVVGGSLGSGALNDAVPALLVALAGRDAAVIHVTGPRYAGSTPPAVPAGLEYVRLPYCDDMAALYAACDVLVCRAGASTVAEVATVGVASVIVPWSGAADDHQRRNAAWLVEAGAALSVPDGDTNALVDAVASLVGDRVGRLELAAAARRMGAIHRGDALVKLVRDCAI